MTVAMSLSSAQAKFVEQVVLAHRSINEPVVLGHLGHLFRVHPQVFSPFLAPSGRVGLSFAAWPIFPGKRVLDVGCGSGIITSLIALSGASRVVGVDISPYAVANARANAAALGIESLLEVRPGDLFGPIGRDEIYDIIFADLPFTSGDPQDDLERAFFDKDLDSIRRFIRDAPELLSRAPLTAKAYLCLSTLEPIELTLSELNTHVSCTEVMRVSLEIMSLHLYELRLKR